MKFLFGCLLTAALVLSCRAQTITIQAPATTSYLDSVVVAWSVSPSTASVDHLNLTFTYSSGYYSYISPTPSWNFLLVSNSTLSSFSFAPHTVSPPDSNFVAWTGPSLPMLDGTYQVRFTATFVGGLATFSSITDPSIDTITLPPMVSSPTAGSRWSRFINVSYNLYESPSLSGFPVSVTVVDATSGNTVAAMSLTRILVGSFLLDSFNVTNFTTPVFNVSSAYPSTIPNGVYNITVTSKDNLAHPSNSTTISNVVFQTTTPVPTLYTPFVGDTNVYTTVTGIVINYTIPAPATGLATLTLVHSGISLDNVPTTPIGVPLLYTVPLSTPGICVCNETFVLSYADSLGNAPSSVAANGLIDTVSLPASFNVLHDGSVVFPEDGLDISYTLGEPCSLIQMSFITYLANGTLFRADLFFNGSLSSLDQSYLWDGSMVGNGNPFLSGNATGGAAYLLTNQTYNVFLSVSDQYDNPVVTSGVQLVNYFGAGFQPSFAPTLAPTLAPTSCSTPTPAPSPTLAPTPTPTPAPAPTEAPVSVAPTVTPAPIMPQPHYPTLAPVYTPTLAPTMAPTSAPTSAPTLAPSGCSCALPSCDSDPNIRAILSGTRIPIYGWILLSAGGGILLTVIVVWMGLRCSSQWAYGSLTT